MYTFTTAKQMSLSNILLHTLKNLSCFREYCLLSSPVQSVSQMNAQVPVALHCFHFFTHDFDGPGQFFFLWKSTTIYFVLLTFRRGLFLLESSSPARFASTPETLNTPDHCSVIRELLQVIPLFYGKSQVCKINSNGDRTVPCGGPVLLTTTSDRVPPSCIN